MKEVFLTFLGIPIGILGSILAWWVLYRCLVPRIAFSPHISKYHFGNIGTKYRFKMINFGRRGIIDLEVFPILRVMGLNRQLPNNWRHVTLRTSLNENRISRLRRNRIVTVVPESTEEFGSNNFPEHIRGKYIDKTLGLEDLLDINSSVQLLIHVFGYDEFSGARKFFESKIYTKDDIRYGTFDSSHTIDKTGLEIIQEKEVMTPNQAMEPMVADMDGEGRV